MISLVNGGLFTMTPNGPRNVVEVCLCLIKKLESKLILLRRGMLRIRSITFLLMLIVRSCFHCSSLMEELRMNLVKMSLGLLKTPWRYSIWLYISLNQAKIKLISGKSLNEDTTQKTCFKPRYKCALRQRQANGLLLFLPR